MLKKFVSFLFAVFFVFLSASSAALGEDSGTSTQLRGSGTVMGMIQYTAEAYMKENPGSIISVSGGGTDRGIKSLIDGTCQIAMASTEINSELAARSAERGIRLVKNVIAYDAIVPFVHCDNPVSSLTVNQLKKIYTGQITSWKYVGGKNSPISIASRNLSSGTYEGWKLLVIGDDAVMSPKAVPMDSIPERVFVSRNVNSVGYCAFSYIDSTIKPLAVDNIKASFDTVENGSYPLKRELILYTRDDASAGTSRFVEYVKKCGAQFTKKTGVFPLGR